MTLYFKGYYGYQNRWDELLLLGVLQFLYKKFTNSQSLTIYVESGDVLWLQDWFSKNSDILWPVSNTLIVVSKYNLIQFAPWVTKVIWWGEVITDARKAPHNGWNYLGLYWLSLLCGKVLFLGGIGEPKSWLSKLLWKMLLWWAKEIIVREQTSLERVRIYTKQVTLHRDFAFDILDNIQFSGLKSQISWKYIIINCNSHYWNNDVQAKIQDFCNKYPDHRYIYMPAAMGDDSDMPYFDLLKEKIPSLELYDWRDYMLSQTLGFLAWATAGIATRLHILLPLQYYKVPLQAFVYQEKISKILWL
jgi:polysaccharide pyruvyl transferase WcaK-like protein